jgi:hypothetical protein
MSKQKQSIGSISFTSTGAIARYRYINRLGAQAATEGALGLGFATKPIVSGEVCRIDFGSTEAESGAIIDGTNPNLMTDVTGRMIPYVAAANKSICAILKPGQTASAAGQVIEVIPTYGTV